MGILRSTITAASCGGNDVTAPVKKLVATRDITYESLKKQLETDYPDGTLEINYFVPFSKGGVNMLTGVTILSPDAEVPKGPTGGGSHIRRRLAEPATVDSRCCDIPPDTSESDTLPAGLVAAF